MLGRFLEVSIRTPDIQASLAFYESLGFQQAPVGEIWQHPYAVVTDGRLCLGLHQYAFHSPSLTFVQPELAWSLRPLRRLGIEFAFERLGDEVFNEAGFLDPLGQMVTLLEARTFSPPALESCRGSICGYFSEFAQPAREFEPARQFWEALGFIALDEEALPFPRQTLTSDHLNLGLYRSRAVRQPMLSFEDEAMPERLAQLRADGHTLTDEMPESLDERENAVLVAPEGTRLLLMRSIS